MDDQETNRDGGGISEPMRSRSPHIDSPLAKRALIGFFLGFAILVTVPIVSSDLFLLLMVGGPAFVLTFISGGVFIGAL